MIKIPAKLPYTVKRVARYPFPCKRSLCPGKTLSAESSSGAPRKIEGRKSVKVWVIDIEVIKTASGNEKKAEGRVREREDMRLICIPGIRPVIVPAIIPMKRARSSNNI